MDSNKKYWKGLEELNKTPEFVEKNKHEFAEPLPIEEVLSGAGLASKTPRRDFLKALGFGVGAVTLAACQKVPVHKSIPYLIKPEEVTPGVANYYTSTYNGHAILVKTREGRPIKIEGNPNDLLAGGGLSAQGQASVLDLYNSNRVKDPKINGGDAGWEQLDDFVIAQLTAIQAAGKGIRVITSTVHSPSTQAVIADFIAKYPATKHINYDAYSYSGIIRANQQSFGKAVIPHYNFDKADVIVSFAADFLGSWISGEEFTRQYVSNRGSKSLEEKKMSRHIQFESGMSVTGTNADNRFPIKLSEEGLALVALYNAISGTTLPGTKKLTSANADTAIVLAAKELLAAKGKALVVCGSNSVSKQVLVNAINSLLGSYGTTIDLDNPSNQYKGNDAEFVAFIEEAKRGEIGAALFLDANPAYDYFNRKDLKDALAKIKLKVSFSDQSDETASLCNVIAPNHHYLESWGDDNSIAGYYTVVQPTINPVYNTRQAEQSLLIWSGSTVQDYYTYVRNNWTTNLLALGGLSGEAGWESLLQTGFIKTTPATASAYAFAGDINTAAQNVITNSAALAAPEDKVEVQLYQSTGVGDGRYANNPWLQELPDAVSKVTWDNYAAIAPKYAEKLGLEEGDVVKIEANGYAVEVPVLFQPGQAQGTVSIAVGYGRTHAGMVGNGVGANVYPFSSFRGGTIHKALVASLSKTGDVSPLAQTQTHHSFEGRDVIRETTFKDYVKDPASGSGHGQHHKMYDLWENSKFEKPIHHWGMAIDLNACTGCGACIVACNVENNIPVVGKDEVRRRREMHWIRIDRYYSYANAGKKAEEVEENGTVTREKEIEKLDDLDNVTVVHQPMLCQHCDHAPCETVCPVLATVHSSEGLNQMAYNRCVGTRYCANNCPYKVRRFNWFNYWNDSRFDNYLQNEHTQLVLNPDVTTRFRGVMEKCSFCVQRIQAGKLKAKIEKRPLKDGDVKVACAQTCSANAIIFGDLNDPNSELSKALKSERTYYVLQELNVQPGIGYQVKVRNNIETELQA
ncbi:molybdopterin oxidoreductase [Mucilaginibacter hurinus]|uniref:Molybdopterin oxidoreductase n=1 Tax=Mucilaginibacter hurinus TaxID=2201324 RepID=A0A367GQ30_9SPHI|nr:TAT-variant-translocated molybdopterin oxidoreductase [Mucilaginibacter hurinus]RCH54813.1 molybdopterin oxidoreductase [Mucilaginibacter hurinus]